MALEDFDGGNGIYLKLKHGYLCQESKTEKEGWKKVEGEFDGTPYKKWIRPYKSVSGYIDKIERYDREFSGRKIRGWNITITDGEAHYVLDIPFSSVKVNSRWMKLAESIDYNKPVHISGWLDKKSDSMAINIQQDGVTVPQKYTREDPGEMPEPIQRSSGKWDYGAQEDFLVERLLKFVIPNVELIAAKRNEGKPAEQPKEPESGTTESNGLENDYSESDSPMRDIQRSVTALAGTKVVNGAGESEILKEYFGTDKWTEVEMLPEGLLKAMAAKLDNLIPF